MSRPQISVRVTAARERLGWSREALAYHSGLSWSAIAQIESGRRANPRPETLLSLARALGVTVGYLVGDTPRSLLAHSGVIYDTDDAFIGAIVPFVLEGLARGEPVLVVVSERNLDLLRRELPGPSDDVTLDESSHWYVSPLSAVAAFRSFTDERTEAGSPWIRVVGEPTWPSGSEADVRLWATYESMFNLLFEAAPLTVLCPYDSTSLAPSIVEVARETHPYLAQGTRLQTNEAFVDPAGFVLGR